MTTPIKVMKQQSNENLMAENLHTLGVKSADPTDSFNWLKTTATCAMNKLAYGRPSHVRIHTASISVGKKSIKTQKVKLTLYPASKAEFPSFG